MLWPADEHLPPRPVHGHTPHDRRRRSSSLCARVLGDRRDTCAARRAWLAIGHGWPAVRPRRRPSDRLAVDRCGGQPAACPLIPTRCSSTSGASATSTSCGATAAAWSGRALLRTYYRVRVVAAARAADLDPPPLRARSGAHAVSSAGRWRPSLHDFIDLFLTLLADVAGTELPYIAPWPRRPQLGAGPHPRRGDRGRPGARLDAPARDRAGPRRALVLELRAPPLRRARRGRAGACRPDGFEVGVHGLHHDGRDLSSFDGLRARLPAIHAAAQRWRGCRLPLSRLSHRRWDWMRAARGSTTTPPLPIPTPSSPNGAAAAAGGRSSMASWWSCR